jgi:outer membrane protein
MTRSSLLSLSLAVAGFTVVLPANSSAQVRVVSLEDAIELAVLNNPIMVQRLGEIQIAQAGRREFLGNWLPSLSGSGSWATNSGQQFDQVTQQSVSSNSTSYSAGLSASYTIFDGFRREASGRSSSAEVVTADANLINESFATVLATKTAFFQALAGAELVRVSETRIARAEGQLKISRDKLAAGSAIRSDTLQSFVETANARLQLVNAATQRAIALSNIQRLTGINEAIDVQGDTALNRIIGLDTAALRTEVLINAPVVIQSEAALRVADANVAVSKSSYFRSVSASYSQNWNGRQVSVLNNTWSARLSMSYPIFNGFVREAGVVRSNVNQEAAIARYEDTKRQVNSQLTQFLLALQSADIRMDLATASREAAEEALRVQQERYRLGAATIVEVLASQVNLDQAEVDIVQARLDYLTSKAQIEALIGREL